MLRRIIYILSRMILFFFLFSILIAIGEFVYYHLGGALGFIFALVTGLCLAIGMLCIYHNSINLLNLFIIWRHDVPLRDGKVVAFSGFVRTDTAPLVSPLKETICAAYAYTVFGSSSSDSSPWLAEGYHMVKSRIEGNSQSLQLRSAPGLDEFRETLKGQEWVDKALILNEKISSITPPISERKAMSRNLEIKLADNIEEIHDDYYHATYKNEGNDLNIIEKALPVGQEVCVIGTYNKALNCLTSHRSRLGHNLMIYPGSAKEVLARLGEDVTFLAKAAVICLGISGLIIGAASLSTESSSKSTSVSSYGIRF